jgi:hypothetical protein
VSHQPKPNDPKHRINGHDPLFDLDNHPVMRVGMGEEAAFKAGWRTAWFGYDTRHINALTKNTPEWKEWERGYDLGTQARSTPSTTHSPPTDGHPIRARGNKPLALVPLRHKPCP